MAIYPEEIKSAAKSMWCRKFSVKDIAEHLNVASTRVIYQWAEKGCWNDMLSHETPEQAATRRLTVLIEKNDKTDADYKEIDKLCGVLDKLANIDIKKRKSQTTSGGNSSSKRDSNKNKNKKKNCIDDISATDLEKYREKLFFKYQHRWYENKHHRTRFILKSRQIGATYYFAYEAFEDAVLTGDNQIFLSASRAQAEVFKGYIQKFAYEFGVELTGSDVIRLSNGAELRFISTNSRTAQSYHGHLYIDEVFWIPDFEKLNKLASAMASQKKWRKTYISTPSVKSHGAFGIWSGDRFNEGKKKKYTIDLKHEFLRDGALGEDRIWRNVVTLVDAMNDGCDLFDIDQLKSEYTDVEFNNLFMCAFLEAGQSVFNLDQLLACAIDSSVVWVDFERKKVRPFANRPVWIGYDPARNGDKSCVVVVAPPLKAGEKFRVLEKIQLSGSFSHQAARIRDLTDKYTVKFIGIDSTGVGLGVYEQVKTFFPAATPIHYGIETKTSLVLKAIDVVENNRIEWDAEHTDIAQAFLQVRQSTTSTQQITYVADRNTKTGHADAAYSIMHALSNEPLTRKSRKTSVTFAK